MAKCRSVDTLRFFFARSEKIHFFLNDTPLFLKNKHGCVRKTSLKRSKVGNPQNYEFFVGKEANKWECKREICLRAKRDKKVDDAKRGEKEVLNGIANGIQCDTQDNPNVDVKKYQGNEEQQQSSLKKENKLGSLESEREGEQRGYEGNTSDADCITDGGVSTPHSEHVTESVRLIKGEYYDMEICELLSKSFLSYANFLILNRCLCDYRDGLKTVQRRIIWSMYEINKGLDKKSYKKCARIVGEVIGKYHPHGDKSVYDALVRLAQKHHNNNLLINGYGNFGSVEYNPAAMRYTEARISNFCYDILLDEINYENVEYIKNFDGNEKEPKVLCSKVPLLLVNGCSGIAVSILSNIPSHNLIDVINCSINFLINSNITNEELFNIIKGPDFSTGGIIISKKNFLKNMYSTGKGNILIRSNVFYEHVKNNKTYIYHINDLTSLNSSEFEKGSKKLIIKNLPPNVKPNELIENIVSTLNEKKNEHENILSRIRDESEKEDMRIVLELRKHSQIEQILNFLSFLFKYTQMEINYHCNFVCIGFQNSYTQFSLKSFIQLWCENRIKFIKKNYQIKNNNLTKELNIINLYLIIQKRIVEIVSFLHKQHDVQEIKNFFKNNFHLNEEQIKYILGMKIQKLINIKNVDFLNQKNDILHKMKLNEDIINDVQKIKKIIINELIYIKNKYGINKLQKNISPSYIKYKYTYINQGKDNNYWNNASDSSKESNCSHKFILQGERKNATFVHKGILMAQHTESVEEGTPIGGVSRNGERNGRGSNTKGKDLDVVKSAAFEKKKKTEDAFTGSVSENNNSPFLDEHENGAENTPQVQYRNTFIDAFDTNVNDMYNNDEVLILITYGGYIKKIKINEKLKNHPNNIMKLSNVKYILKQNEENLNEKKRHQEKHAEQQSKSAAVQCSEVSNGISVSDRGSGVGIDSDSDSNSGHTRSSTNMYKIKKGILCRNRDRILLTDNFNKAYLLNVHDLHPSSYDSKGTPINQIIKCSKSITGLTKYEENEKYLIVCSENGKMKIINNDVFLKKKKKGIKLFKNKKNIFFSYCNFDDNCIVGTKNGYIIQFPLSSFKISKKNSLGNKCISLSKNDKVVDLLSYENNEYNMNNLKIVLLSKNGFGKMINLDELKIQKKKGKGYKIMKFKKAKMKGKINNQLFTNEQENRNKMNVDSDKEHLAKESHLTVNSDETHVQEKYAIIEESDQSNDYPIRNADSDEFLGFKLYDMKKKKENDLLIMITDHAVLIRKNMSLLKKKNRKHSSQIYAKLNKINKLMYFDIM
ncbi:DNA GyrAse a-subunit [Plasmodium ovale curtisi]|uniref:DNA topoisomerase (ATP-hydrolyzing) n=1 Tax=Plasmodium ovale curtisi TaxID=864141 RepID=A0A1A8W6C7_PLAOA|nr:DNA GyrAse a-subunit [Plasmodium ovale curtisi]SBS98344.1 DNA GyrAse a-subunit [Plasmodium ovale curtisi]